MVRSHDMCFTANTTDEKKKMHTANGTHTHTRNMTEKPLSLSTQSVFAKVCAFACVSCVYCIYPAVRLQIYCYRSKLTTRLLLRNLKLNPNSLVFYPIQFPFDRTVRCYTVRTQRIRIFVSFTIFMCGRLARPNIVNMECHFKLSTHTMRSLCFDAIIIAGE